MKQEVWNDIVEWDVTNWKRAIENWNSIISVEDIKNKKVLDLGARNGGLSLYFALLGAKVVCSDIDEKRLIKAKKLHKMYHLENQIEYQSINAVEIPQIEEFDYICFKSVLGGVGYNNDFSSHKKMMSSIYSALKTRGAVLFVENLKASKFHQILRAKFQPWGASWRYIDLDEIMELLAQYSKVYYETIGYFGCMGRKETMRCRLSAVDKKIEKRIKDKNRYIISCVAIK